MFFNLKLVKQWITEAALGFESTSTSNTTSNVLYIVFDILVLVYSGAILLIILGTLISQIVRISDEHRYSEDRKEYDEEYDTYAPHFPWFIMLAQILFLSALTLSFVFLVCDVCERCKRADICCSYIEGLSEIEILSSYKWNRYGKAMSIGISLIGILFSIIGAGLTAPYIWDLYINWTKFPAGVNIFMLSLIVIGLTTSLVSNCMLLLASLMNKFKKESILQIHMVHNVISILVTTAIWIYTNIGKNNYCFRNGLFEFPEYAWDELQDQTLCFFTWLMMDLVDVLCFTGIMTQFVFIVAIRKVHKMLKVSNPENIESEVL